jgi:predicted nucleotidyltransferase component of viral defense system
VEIQIGRRDFVPEDYKRFDPLGKNLGYKLVKHFLKDYPNLKIISSKYRENYQCGDLVLINSLTDKEIRIEFECRNPFAFNQNFDAKFPTVDVPMKKLEQMKNGWYIAFDQEEIFTGKVPNKYYMAKAKDILDKDKVQTHLKFIKATNKWEEFFAIPNYLVSRMLWSETLGDYEEYYV